MKSSEMINNIKTLLNIEVKLEEMKLENGTVVEAESFEKGKELFIKTDDERVAMPVGEYLLEDGRLVVVEEEGIIADVREVSDEVPAKENEEGEEITSDLADEKEEMAYATKEELSSAVEEMKSMIEEIKAMVSPKEEMSDDEVELSKNIKEELSAPAAEPIKHSPEAESAQVEQKVFAQSKVRTTLDRVLNKLNK